MKLSFVGVGPMRAGTTWLHRALSLHPRVVLPREKETFYFDENFDRGPAWYEAHFPPGPAGAIYGEIGASYFASSAARERIVEAAPGARIVVSVRDPVERAFSTFHHLRKTRRLPESIIEASGVAPEILSSGAYSVHLPAWEARFGEANVVLVTMDEIVERPHDALARLLTALGLPPLDPHLSLGGRVNDAYVPPSPRLHRLRAAVFRHLVDNQRFRTLAVARSVKRVATRLVPARSSGARAMTPEERAFLEERLASERAFLAARSSAPGPRRARDRD